MKIDNCLFITRQFFDPAHSGAFIYSRQFVDALCEIMDQVDVFACINDEWPVEGVYNGSTLRGFPGNLRLLLQDFQEKGRILQNFSLLPAIASRFCTSRSRERLRGVLRDDNYNAIIIDGIASCWVLKLVKGGGASTVVHLAHNDEYKTKLNLLKSSEVGGWEWFAHWVDSIKLRKAEDELIQEVDAVCCISDDDKLSFLKRIPGARLVVSPAGYSGDVVISRKIDDSLPRRVCLVGSFQWGAKRLNLKAFLSVGYRLFQDAGIEMFVVGNMDDDFREEMSCSFPDVVFTGKVDDVSGYLASSRIGVIPEEVGGGFKLKLFEYVFNRLPIFALCQSVSQVPLVAGKSAILQHDMESLCKSIVDYIDDINTLNQLQDTAYDLCRDYVGNNGILKSLNILFGD